MTKALYDDPVVAEIHFIREKLIADCGGDVEEYVRQARARQAASGRKVVSRPLKERTEPNVGPETSTDSLGDG